ncbi:MAG: hypothetical protein AAF433_03755 [Bacteroidota bacterium]
MDDTSQRIDVAYLVSHGFAARMVTQTNLLGELVQAGLKVALITPDARDINLKIYCERAEVSLYEFSPANSLWTPRYAKSRMYFLENINRNPALLEKYKYAVHVRPAKRWIGRIRPRLLKVIHDAKERFPIIRSCYLKREHQLLASSKAAQLIASIAPRILVATYPVDFSEGMLLKAAASQHRQTLIQLLSWDNISCKGHFPQLADDFLVWGEIMAEELREYYGVEEKKIHRVGVPHFDLHLQVREKPEPASYLATLGLLPDQPYLFFGMSSPRFAPREINIVEWLAQQVRGGLFGPDMQLVIRPHPQNVQGSLADKSWLPRLEALNGNMVGVDFPDLSAGKMPWSMQQQDMERMSHLLAGSSLCLNSGSTLSIDALMCRTPVILTSFDGKEELPYWESARRLVDYSHLQKLVCLRGVEVAKNYEELTNSIKVLLSNPNYHQNFRNKTIQLQCANAIGNSATTATVDWLRKRVNRLE